ncbi:MAG TPA: metallopeptidase family protein [Candidatus Limnocylindrales bacterium]|nr:metallopeptidase family protein [Candidatus Limnocylindrales bacterium]
MTKRVRGSGRRRGPARAAREARRGAAFDALVDRALASIPDPFRAALGEVAVIVEEEPSDEQLLDNGLTLDDSMYGLYEGVPRTAYAADWALSPNRITLFRAPLEWDFPDPDELEAEVRRTVVHELAHHLGIDDERLDELGAG